MNSAELTPAIVSRTDNRAADPEVKLAPIGLDQEPRLRTFVVISFNSADPMFAGTPHVIAGDGH